MAEAHRRSRRRPGRGIALVAALALGSVIAAPPAAAAPPLNDDFTDAFDLDGMSPVLVERVGTIRVTGSNVDGSVEPAEPIVFPGNKSVWWGWTAPSSIGSVSISTRGSTFDTVIEVFTGDTLDSLTSLASNDDDLPWQTSAVRLLPLEGQRYWISVFGFRGSVGAIELALSWNPAELAGAASSQTRPGARSISPGASADARHVVFSAPIGDILGGTEAELGVFRRETRTGITDVAAATSTGAALSGLATSISGDGRYVTYTDGLDLFLRDMEGATTPISTTTTGGSGCCTTEGVVADGGALVAFESTAPDLVADTTPTTGSQVYVRDVVAEVTTLISRGATGGPANGPSGSVSMSADGRHVAFRSAASDLVAGDVNGAIDVFVHDRVTAVTRLVSSDDAGVAGNGHSILPMISADGRFVTFTSSATNLVAQSTGGRRHVYVHDLTRGTTQLGSVRDGTTTPHPTSSFASSLSGDGRFVAFSSRDGDGSVAATEVRVLDRSTGAVTLVTDGAHTTVGGFEATGRATISRDGRFVVLETPSVLTEGDRNDAEDVFVLDRGVPSAPTSLSVAASTRGILTISWAQPATSGMFPSTSLVDRIRVLDPAGAAVFDETVPASAAAAATPATRTITATGFTPGAVHAVEVFSANAVGAGPAATAVTTLPHPLAGYSMLDAGGNVYGFGDAPSVAKVASAAAAVALQTSADGTGTWILTADGVVHVRGTATHFGDVDRSRLARGEVPSALSIRSDGMGYWVFTDRGRVLGFGAAGFYGDVSDLVLNGPVVASVAAPDDAGYYLIASDGGVFALGSARFAGSMGGVRLNAPVVGIAPDPDGRGYWLVASDGGIFAFEAAFAGSLPGVLGPGASLNRPVIGAIAYGDAYLMVASDGGIFNFSDRPFLGSLGASPPVLPVTAVSAFTT